MIEMTGSLFFHLPILRNARRFSKHVQVELIAMYSFTSVRLAVPVFADGMYWRRSRYRDCVQYQSEHSPSFEFAWFSSRPRSQPSSLVWHLDNGSLPKFTLFVIKQTFSTPMVLPLTATSTTSLTWVHPSTAKTDQLRVGRTLCWCGYNCWNLLFCFWFWGWQPRLYLCWYIAVNGLTLGAELHQTQKTKLGIS